MHGLETIQRLNREAHERGIDSLRAAGLWVVSNWIALHLVSFESHSTQEAAQAAASAACDAGDRRVVHPPMSDAERAEFRGRDQSEDYAVKSAA